MTEEEIKLEQDTAQEIADLAILHINYKNVMLNCPDAYFAKSVLEKVLVILEEKV